MSIPAIRRDDVARETPSTVCGRLAGAAFDQRAPREATRRGCVAQDDVPAWTTARQPPGGMRHAGAVQPGS